MTRELVWKTRLFALFVILSNSFGNLFIFIGMHKADDVTASPLAFLYAIFQPQVSIGILLLIAWLLTRMMMMSWADLTYVLPVTAFGYVISAWLGALFLNEVITLRHWVGILFIVAGTILVGLQAPESTGERTSR